MKIQFGTYFIEGDGDGFIIYELFQKKNKEGVLTGKLGKGNIRWHPSLESACIRVFGLLISCSDKDDLESFIRYIKDIKDEIISEVKEALQDK